MTDVEMPMDMVPNISGSNNICTASNKQHLPW